MEAALADGVVEGVDPLVVGHIHSQGRDGDESVGKCGYVAVVFEETVVVGEQIALDRVVGVVALVGIVAMAVVTRSTPERVVRQAAERLARRDAAGLITYCGRGDDAMKVGGRWLVPLEVESCLCAHAEVR